ncbi:MAG: alpha-galactosidase [Erysipelotrichaceae bacterium]|jgi:alpha-galactosidase
MIKKVKDHFILETRNTTYIFKILANGYLAHLYYGSKYDNEIYKKSKLKINTTGNTVNYSIDFPYALEDIPLEYSSYGKGDIREPLIVVRNHDGSNTSDFIFDSYEIVDKKKKLETLPSSYDCDGQLVISLADEYYNLKLQLFYSVFYQSDVIVRSCKFINSSNKTVKLEKIYSSLIDMQDKTFTVTSFFGNWANEMNKQQVKLNAGKYVISSYTGTSSSRNNPFFMLSSDDTDETKGECYGFNLVYSGNHYSSIETTQLKRTRIIQGINSENFEFEISADETFETPEAVMTYSNSGFNGISKSMHYFVNNHIIRGNYKNKIRPVLLNSWEAAYFDIDEEKLLSLAEKGKEAGVELFVMDDGWFGKRIDDYRSLGDWYENKEKLPSGLKGLCDKVNGLGLHFGLWVEPEMVNVDSDLYRAHPDWAMEIKGKHHSEGRNQRILDIINPEVSDYILNSLKRVFNSCNVIYVKWDFNRIFSDVYSPFLKNRQKETLHRYYISFYKIISTLVEEFPDILFEGCSAGGNRFDLGKLCYFPQIWASDNTDAIVRVNMQNGYSYGYPLSSYTCHVSICPNHQTGRVVPLKTRFDIACFGNLGYELNLNLLTESELQEVKKQIEFYKKHRELIQFGDFKREDYDNGFKWSIVMKEQIIEMIYYKDKQITEIKVNGEAYE